MLRHVPEPSRIYHSSQAKGIFLSSLGCNKNMFFSKITAWYIQPRYLPPRCLLSSCLEILNIASWELTYPLKMDGWNTTFLLGNPIFRCYVSFREGIPSCHWEVFHLGAASQSQLNLQLKDKQGSFPWITQAWKL